VVAIVATVCALQLSSLFRTSSTVATATNDLGFVRRLLQARLSPVSLAALPLAWLGGFCVTVDGDGPTAVHGWVWNDWQYGDTPPQNLVADSLLWSQLPVNCDA
jgi:hypothetical protein